jgi:hypothetical protein
MFSVEICVLKMKKICQETGKKIRESKTVQKSAKLVHLTFKVCGVRGLQLHIF